MTGQQWTRGKAECGTEAAGLPRASEAGGEGLQLQLQGLPRGGPAPRSSGHEGDEGRASGETEG